MGKMNFYDYSFEQDNSLLCNLAYIKSTGLSVEVDLLELEPKSLVNMIMGWDEDVIEALIRELQKRIRIEQGRAE